jgi:hypothetical protein
MPVATRTNTRQGTLDSPSKRTKTASIDSPGGDVDMSSYTGTSPSPGSLDSAGPTREMGNSGSGWNTPAMTSPSVEVSMLAKHGSAPPSPVLKGLKDGGYFPPPQPKGWSRADRADDWSTTGARPNLEINTNANDNMKPAEKRGSEVDHKNKAFGLIQAHANANTRKNLRVIGVDFDDVCAQFIPTVCLEHNLRYGSDITEWVVTSRSGPVILIGRTGYSLLLQGGHAHVLLLPEQRMGFSRGCVLGTVCLTTRMRRTNIQSSN